MTARIRPFLRDEVVDRAAWRRELLRLRDAAQAAGEAGERASVLGRLGEMLRLSSLAAERAESIAVLRRAVAAARRSGRRTVEAANRIRLGIALQYAGRHDEAAAAHRAALRVIAAGRLPGLRDFALQHLGKGLVEAGRDDEAMDCFVEALKIRRKRGDAALEHSTLEAIAALRLRQQEEKE